MLRLMAAGLALVAEVAGALSRVEEASPKKAEVAPNNQAVQKGVKRMEDNLADAFYKELQSKLTRQYLHKLFGKDDENPKEPNPPYDDVKKARRTIEAKVRKYKGEEPDPLIELFIKESCKGESPQK